MPEVDPAMYNLRFAHRLDFGRSTNTVATDASRLVRRFKADWMTQGRRPAGVCGACLIIAARMSDYMRTPEEVGQVVKVSPVTVRRRLREFAQTEMADRTVAQWRDLSDAQLSEDRGELPPVVKAALAKEAKAARERARVAIEAAQAAADADEENDEELFELDEMYDSSEEEATPKNRRRKARARRLEVELPLRRSTRRHPETEGVVRAAAAEATGDSTSTVEEEVDELDDDLEPLPEADYVHELEAARDDPESAKADREARARAFLRENRAISNTNADPLETQATLIERDDDADSDALEKLDEDAELDMLDAVDAHVDADLQDPEDTIRHFSSKYFAEEARLFHLDERQVRDRVRQWLLGRDPREVLDEIRAVDRARREADRVTRLPAEYDFRDLDDDELDRYWVMEEDERDTRARLWLSHNGKWLQKDRGESR